MNAMIALLLFKVSLTLFKIVRPFLLFPAEKLERTTGFKVTSIPFFRLYGVAMLSLTVAYLGGLWLAINGQFPWIIVFMGIVSNCGAGLILFMHDPYKKARSQALLFSCIGGAFGIFAMFPDFAMSNWL